MHEDSELDDFLRACCLLLVRARCLYVHARYPIFRRPRRYLAEVGVEGRTRTTRLYGFSCAKLPFVSAACIMHDYDAERVRRVGIGMRHF